MSIPLADATTLPSAVPIPPTTLPAEGGGAGVLWMVLAWTAIGLFVAQRLGAFRSNSVHGPARLPSNESAWDLAIIGSIGFAVEILVVTALYSQVHTNAGLQQLIFGAAGDGSMLLAIVLALFYMRPGWLTGLGLNRRKIGTGIIGGAATLFCLYPLVQLTSGIVDFIYTRLRLVKANPHEVLQIIGGARNSWLVAFAVLLAVVIAPITEELFYRGLLQTMLAQMFDWLYGRKSSSLQLQDKKSPTPAARWSAVILTSMAFAAVHKEVAFLAPIFVLAVGLGYIYERTGNLWVTMTAHALFNGAQIALYRASLP